MKPQAKIEYINQPHARYKTQPAKLKGKFPKRFKVFVITFLLCLAVGLTVNYARPAVYQSSATLLTFASTAIDQHSGDIDFQHVTIQKQKLLGFEMLSGVLQRIQATGNNELTLADIRNMLHVEAIENTNLLKMIASGAEPDILPRVINTWIDVYLSVSALNVSHSTENTVELVENELITIDKKIKLTEHQLQQFREKHDISSIDREDNEQPARLSSLRQALNDANEALVKTKAKLDAVNSAIASGQSVVPLQEQGPLAQLETRLQVLTEKMITFDKRFTRDYLKFQPEIQAIPEKIKQIKQEIAAKQAIGQNIVWTKVNQDYFAAKQVAVQIRQQLNAHKAGATNFSGLLTQYQKLVADLEAFELISRETKERLLKIESKQFDQYPQVDVVERASVNRQSVGPDYMLGLLIVLFSSLLIAFLTVWFVDFLMREQEAGNLSNSADPTWHEPLPQHDALTQQMQSTETIEQQHQPELTHTAAYYDMTVDDVMQLLAFADKKTQQLILLLLSGLTLEEISDLHIEQVNHNASQLKLGGISAREIQLGTQAQLLLIESVQQGVLWKDASVDALKAMLYCCEVDAGMSYEQGRLAISLRRAYIIYLVEQGVRLSLLPDIVGVLRPLELAEYAVFSPALGGCEVDDIELIYPVCHGV